MFSLALLASSYFLYADILMFLHVRTQTVYLNVWDLRKNEKTQARNNKQKHSNKKNLQQTSIRCDWKLRWDFYLSFHKREHRDYWNVRASPKDIVVFFSQNYRK